MRLIEKWALVLCGQRWLFANQTYNMVFIEMPLAREGNGTPLQYSCLENPMDTGAWWAAVHGVTKSWTRLSDFTFTFTFHFRAPEKEMATHSSVLAWRIPGTGEPGGLPSMGSHRVGHNWSDLAAGAETFIWDYQQEEFAEVKAGRKSKGPKWTPVRHQNLKVGQRKMS